MQTLVCLAFFIFTEKLTHLQNVMLFNIMHLEGMEQFHNIWAALYSLMMFYLLDLAYCKNNGYSSVILHDILIRDKSDYFLWSSLECEDTWLRSKRKQRFKIVHRRSKSSISARIKSTAVWIRNGFQILYFAMCKF